MPKLKYYRTGAVEYYPLNNPSSVALYGNKLFLFRRMGMYAKLTTHTPNGKRLVRVEVDERGTKGTSVVLQRLDKSLFEVPRVDVRFMELSIEGVILDKLGDLEYILGLYPETFNILYRIRSENITIRYKEKVTTQFHKGYYNLNLPVNFNIALGYVEF